MSPRERAARALYEREPLYFHPARDPLKRSCVMPWEEADDGWRAPYYARVDAVLDEIRTPSDGVKEAAFIADADMNGQASIGTMFTAMIDAIKRGEG